MLLIVGQAHGHFCQRRQAEKSRIHYLEALTNAVTPPSMNITRQHLKKSFLVAPLHCSKLVRRPQHILEFVNHSDMGPALLSALTNFINLLLRGDCPD